VKRNKIYPRKYIYLSSQTVIFCVTSRQSCSADDGAGAESVGCGKYWRPDHCGGGVCYGCVSDNWCYSWGGQKWGGAHHSGGGSVSGVGGGGCVCGDGRSAEVTSRNGGNEESEDHLREERALLMLWHVMGVKGGVQIMLLHG
jgi:hypothetical protein